MKRTLLFSLLLAAAALAGPARAAFLPQATAAPGSAPQGINYQGRLEDNGFPATGTKQMLFRVFDVASGGAALWTSPSQAVSVTLGLFNAVVPVPITALVGGGARYLEVQIDGTLMSPRELLNSVPYALIAKSVEGTIDVSTAGLAVMANSAAVTPALFISSQTGNVGVGTGSPAAAFDVGGSAQFGSGATKSTFTAAGGLLVPGSVGIGATNPESALEVRSTTDKYVKLGETPWGMRLGALQAGHQFVSLGVKKAAADNIYIAATGNDVAVNHLIMEMAYPNVNGGFNFLGQTHAADGATLSPTNIIHLDVNGNVGIGTTIPAAILDVDKAPSGTSYMMHIRNQNAANPYSLSIEEPAGAAAAYPLINVTNSGGSTSRFRVDSGNYTGMYINSIGNVGIGTTVATSTLTVSGPPGIATFQNNTNLGVLVRGAAGITDYSGIDFAGNGNSNPNARIGVIAKAAGTLMQFGTSNNYTNGITNTAMTIDQGGNVGIGTTTPTAKLTIGSAGAIQINNAANNNNATIQVTSNEGAAFAELNLFGGAGLGTGITIKNGGNVGIGTTGPNAKLQVAGGDVYASTAGNGFIAKSPDGLTCRRIGIDNTGAIVATAVACP